MTDARAELAKVLSAHRRVRANSTGSHYACNCGKVLKNNSIKYITEHQADEIIKWLEAGSDSV